MSNTLIIIPARGGSKGIPRKNLRTLAGKPLIYYSINCALNSKHKPDVYVSSEDEEILSLANKFGAKTHQRTTQLSDDKTTLDPVIFEAYNSISKVNNKSYDLVVTLQPTSPLLKTNSLDRAIDQILSTSNIDTIISSTEDTHLTWSKSGDSYIPNYKKRVNRQYLPKVYKETGGFLITRSNCISELSRLGHNIQLYELSSGENIDIDDHFDWNLCEYLLKRKHIVFVVAGNKTIGLGHVANVLSIANDILNHQISIICLKGSELAYEKIKDYNYPTYLQSSEDLINDVLKLKPDVVINDILDTSVVYMKGLKKESIYTVNFEDLGPGHLYSDALINALYTSNQNAPNQYFGHEYFCIKDEFNHTKPYQLNKKVKKVLITFGGVDPSNFTRKTLNAIYEYCKINNLKIEVITGFGYKKFETLSNFDNALLLKNVKSMADHMNEADIAFTSGGRTSLELASIGVPTIVMCQNERELTHEFSSSKNGFINLGLDQNADEVLILENFKKLCESFKLREEMHKKFISFDLKQGKRRVLNIINKVLD